MTSKTGEWLCMVYIQVDGFEQNVPRRLESIHVSLSKPFCLAIWEIEPMREALMQCVRGMQPFTMRLCADELITLESSSPDSETSFICMPVTTGRLQISTLIDHVDACLARFGRPPYFTERILHASIATFADTEEEKDAVAYKELENHVQTVNNIVFKAGHLRHVLCF